jgi:hypothetical protein
MGIEYSNIILNINRKPSRKSFLTAIPMYRYRIETNEFSYGLNFFQKAVLKLKARPGTANATIANLLGLDERLVALIVSELQDSRLINEHGVLSDKGKEKLWEVDGLVVDSNKKKIAYVFKFLNQDKLYQYYVDKCETPNLSEENPPKLITGTKGDGDWTETPFFLNETLKSRITVPCPDEREILDIIKNSSRKPNTEVSDNNSSEKLRKQLSLRYIPNDKPEIVWVCTWIYLQEREDSTYEPDWRVLDPFGFEDNIAMKFYLNTNENKKLLDKVNLEFADVETIGQKKIFDYQEQINKVVEEKLLLDFSVNFSQLDSNLRQYLQAILKNYILLQNQNYNDMDSCMLFALNLQNVLENILKQDSEKRKTTYQLMLAEFEPNGQNSEPSNNKKRKAVIEIWKLKLLSKETRVPQKILNTTNACLTKSKSLLQYLTSFILTYNFDNKSNLFKVLNNRIDTVVEIAQLRNEKGHGQTSNERALSLLSKDDVERFYCFIKELINEYLNY